MCSLMCSRAPLRVYKLFGYWVLENHWDAKVYYCDTWNTAVAQVDVELLEQLVK